MKVIRTDGWRWSNANNRHYRKVHVDRCSACAQSDACLTQFLEETSGRCESCFAQVQVPR